MSAVFLIVFIFGVGAWTLHEFNKFLDRLSRAFQNKWDGEQEWQEIDDRFQSALTGLDSQDEPILYE